MKSELNIKGTAKANKSAEADLETEELTLEQAKAIIQTELGKEKEEDLSEDTVGNE